MKPNFAEIFSAVWKIDSSSKIRNFLWRSLSSSLSVGTELRRRRINGDASCRLCGHEKEDVNHLLFHCDLAREVWTQPSIASLFEDGFSESLQQNIWTCVEASRNRAAQNGNDTSIGPWILWLIWKARNEFIFQQKTTSGQRILQKAKADAQEWFQVHVNESPLAPAPTAAVLSKWIAPPVSYLKCNVDAAWQDLHDRCGVSWILRDSNGVVRLHGIKVYPKLLSPLEAEATAMVWALTCIWNMGYDKVIFESDSSTLINAIHVPKHWPRLLPFTTEIQGIVARRPWDVRFDHISRQRNVAADALAKYALSFSIYFGSIDNSVPSWLQPSLEC